MKRKAPVDKGGSPETLDQLYCYCECDNFQRHKNLLSCDAKGDAAT